MHQNFESRLNLEQFVDQNPQGVFDRLLDVLYQFERSRTSNYLKEFNWKLESEIQTLFSDIFTSVEQQRLLLRLARTFVTDSEKKIKTNDENIKLLRIHEENDSSRAIAVKLYGKISNKLIDLPKENLLSIQEEKDGTAQSEIAPKIIDWKDALGLSNHHVFELYESAEQVQNIPYASDIKKIMNDFDLEGVFCVQNKPEAVIVRQDKYGESELQKVCEAIWNQNLASILLVLESDSVQIFSLLKKFSYSGDEKIGKEFFKKIDLDNKNMITDFFFSLKTGKIFHDNPEIFDKNAQSEQVLLNILTESYNKLMGDAKMDSREAVALLIQTLFIAYLEDRKILSEEFMMQGTKNRCKNLAELLKTCDVALFEKFFACLSNLFNGDLFINVRSLSESKPTGRLKAGSIKILAQFWQNVNESKRSDNFRLNFKYSSIALVSKAYSHLLNLSEGKKNIFIPNLTPQNIVDYALESVWENIEDRVVKEGQFLDPVCGSGSFLVRVLQKVCSQIDAQSNMKALSWPKLKECVERIHGYESDESALRVALFTLYTSMLELASASTINRLLNKTDKLPKLWNKTLLTYDYFEHESAKSEFDVIIGMPRMEVNSTAQKSMTNWCQENNRKQPHGNTAWGYLWKSLMDAKDSGIVALLLPAHDILHENYEETAAARNSLIKKFNVLEVTDFSDLRSQLFEHGEYASTFLIVKRELQENNTGDSDFLYIDPKSDMKFRFDHSISLKSGDFKWLNKIDVQNNPTMFTSNFWVNNHQELKLFRFLQRLPRLSEYADFNSSMDESAKNIQVGWTIGIALQNINNCAYSPDSCRLNVMIDKNQKAFPENFCTVSFPNCDEDKLKFIAAYLRSHFAFWWIFHTNSMLKTGSNTLYNLKRQEILDIPCPLLDTSHKTSQIEDTENAQKIKVDVADSVIKKIVNVKDINRLFKLHPGKDNSEIDNLIYNFLGLTESEIVLIEDALKFNLPAISPDMNDSPKLWQSPSTSERKAFASRLVKSLKTWIKDENVACIELLCRNENFAVLKMFVSSESRNYSEPCNQDFAVILNKLFSDPAKVSSNFQKNPEVRTFDDDAVYLIKPMQFRFWMKSVAVEDAMKIAFDIQKFAFKGKAVESVS